MKKNEYERLLSLMFVIENLGERLYEVMGSKCRDVNLKSVYQELALNEKRTRDCIEKEMRSMAMSLPVRRSRFATKIARPVLNIIPLQWLQRFLTRTLRRRMYSNWRERYCDRNADFWRQLLDHEDMQYRMLNLSK